MCVRQSVPYELLFKELDVSNVRELEDLIIETMYAVRAGGPAVWNQFPQRTHLVTISVLALPGLRHDTTTLARAVPVDPRA